MAKETPKPAPQSPAPAKSPIVERFSPRPTAKPDPEPLKPATYAAAKPVSDAPAVKPAGVPNENMIMGVIRHPGTGTALDADTVRRAVEDVCRGGAEGVTVTPGAGRQLTLSMRVRGPSDWDRLYKQVKALPEVAGYSVIYNVTVDRPLKTATTGPAAPAPMMGIIRTSATSAAADPDAVRAAIEDACRGRADDVSVTPNARHQVAVRMKVRSATEWDGLYQRIKSLPEVAGYAVIYNVSVK
jgi:hypothetical protein